MDSNKATLEALVKAKAKLNEVLRQEFIGGKVDLLNKTLTSAEGDFQLALVESGEVFLRRKRQNAA